MMKPCTIRDLPELAEIFENYYGEDRTLWIRDRIYSPFHFIFLFDSIALYFEKVNTTKHCIHLVGNTKDVKGLRNSLIGAGKWIVDNTTTTCLIAFVDENNKRLQMFVGLSGGKRECTVGGEVLYSFNKDNEEEILRRVRWQ